MYIAWIAIGTLILACETVLWMVFRAKMSRIDFPHEVDESFFRFFSLIRLRLLAVLHTVFLLATFIISSMLLW